MAHPGSHDTSFRGSPIHQAAHFRTVSRSRLAPASALTDTAHTAASAPWDHAEYGCNVEATACEASRPRALWWARSHAVSADPVGVLSCATPERLQTVSWRTASLSSELSLATSFARSSGPERMLGPCPPDSPAHPTL